MRVALRFDLTADESTGARVRVLVEQVPPLSRRWPVRFQKRLVDLTEIDRPVLLASRETASPPSSVD